jgi:hypothetical protein
VNSVLHKMKGLLCFVFLNVMVAACLAGTPFQDCKGVLSSKLANCWFNMYTLVSVDVGSGAVKVTAVDMPGCTGPPCILKKGTNVSISITFTTCMF